MPGTALTAAVLALLGVWPMTQFAMRFAAEAATSAPGSGSLLLWGLAALVLPALHVWGALALLRGRGWLLLVLTALPALGAVGFVLVMAAEAGAAALFIPPVFCAASVVGAGCALAPSTRAWVAARRATVVG